MTDMKPPTNSRQGWYPCEITNFGDRAISVRRSLTLEEFTLLRSIFDELNDNRRESWEPYILIEIVV